jgi:hypothetical protein
MLGGARCRMITVKAQRSRIQHKINFNTCS